MANAELIVKLYKSVLEKQKKQFNVSESQIGSGVREIGEAYSKNPKWENKLDSPSAFYENAANRCAYLHKYAMVHTGLFCDLFDQALNRYRVKEAFDKKKGAESLRLCSLGSGPGTDIVACLFVLKEHFGTQRRPCRAVLVDCCKGWKPVFKDIVSEMKNPEYVGDMASVGNFQYEYVVADLLHFDDSQSQLTGSIKSADVITMVKFVSAAACRDTRAMMRRIFRTMRPGALLLFVDNAAGGFHEMVSQTANECGMTSVFGPLRHYHYKEEAFCREYIHCKSQWETTVTFEIWEKSEALPWNTTSDLQFQFIQRARHLGAAFTDEDFPSLMDAVDGVGRVSESVIENDRVELQCVRQVGGNVAEIENNQKCCTIM